MSLNKTIGRCLLIWSATLVACASDDASSPAPADAGLDAVSGSGGSAGAGGIGGSSGTDGGGDTGTGLPCLWQNPAGCSQLPCPTGTTCDANVGCAPSSCSCNPKTGSWSCSEDCSGGICVGTEDCSSIATALAGNLPSTGSCTAIVRLSSTNLKIVGHAFVCGPTVAVSEAAARATANVDSGYGDGTLVSGANPVDEWVFYTSPGDYGGVSAVSSRTGLSVFGASIVWAGAGKVLYPTTWQKGDIGKACASPPLPAVRGIELYLGKKLRDARTFAAAAAVWRTAIPAALAQVGTIRDVLVLLYPPSPGSRPTAPPEYVVFVNEE